MSGVPTPAEGFRAAADAFGRRVEGVPVGAWDAPAPCAGWVARDVVGHLVDWTSAFLRGGAGVELPAGPPWREDPAGAWAAWRDGVQALLDDPATPGRVLRNPHTGDVALDQAVERFVTPDVFLHTWDLARATGQDERLDEARCAQLLAGMEPFDAALRSSGHYGPRTPVAEGADAQTRLLAFIGRRP
ncbi:TIGR03086 family metal-binding protein [Vallicoccus soli]|uniref:TIGR03086 family metal-binding protein n=1 Tax=Vallicoccus soli TaxID=2339232 RepID=UPI001C4982A7|nr:TIGR03086 family metal-binding protein [Vallicoccus soli]